MILGLKRGVVKLVSNSDIWDSSAKDCIKILYDVLKRDAIDIQHVGSTAIKNIVAKPIVDIVIGVKEFDDILKYNELLLKNGIIYRGQDNANQLLYVMGDMENDIRTHHIHVVIYNGKEWNNYINFRDYLNIHEEQAKEYSQLKIELANRYANSRADYTLKKSNMINEILEDALNWRRSNEDY